VVWAFSTFFQNIFAEFEETKITRLYISVGNFKLISLTFLSLPQTTKYEHFWNQRAICNQKKYHKDIFFELQWLKLTFKQQNFYIFGISEQFAIRKSIISIYRATSNFDLHMRIFNLQGLGAPDRP
jgi:hypothetical protein